MSSSTPRAWAAEARARVAGGAVAALVARGHELHSSATISILLRLSPLVFLPLTPAELAFDRDLRALRQEARERLAAPRRRPPRRRSSGILPLARLLVLATVVDGHAHLQHGHAARRSSALGVAREIAADHDSAMLILDTTFSCSRLGYPTLVLAAANGRPSRGPRGSRTMADDGIGDVQDAVQLGDGGRRRVELDDGVVALFILPIS